MVDDQDKIIKGCCDEDKEQRFDAEVEFDGCKVDLRDVEIAGVNAIASAVATLAAVMNHGVREDYTLRVALGVLSKMDPPGTTHVLCPFFTIAHMMEIIRGGMIRVERGPDGKFKVGTRLPPFLRSAVEKVDLRMVKPDQEDAAPTKQPPIEDGGGIEEG